MNNLIFSLVVIVVGVLFLTKPFITFMVNLKNGLKGIKTEITPYTIWYYRIFGVAAIVTGIILAFPKTP